MADIAGIGTGEDGTISIEITVTPELIKKPDKNGSITELATIGTTTDVEKESYIGATLDISACKDGQSGTSVISGMSASMGAKYNTKKIKTTFCGNTMTASATP